MPSSYLFRNYMKLEFIHLEWIRKWWYNWKISLLCYLTLGDFTLTVLSWLYTTLFFVLTAVPENAYATAATSAPRNAFVGRENKFL